MPPVIPIPTGGVREKMLANMEKRYLDGKSYQASLQAEVARLRSLLDRRSATKNSKRLLKLTRQLSTTEQKLLHVTNGLDRLVATIHNFMSNKDLLREENENGKETSIVRE